MGCGWGKEKKAGEFCEMFLGKIVGMYNRRFLEDCCSRLIILFTVIGGNAQCAQSSFKMDASHYSIEFFLTVICT